MFGKFILLFVVWVGLTNSTHYQELIVGIVVSLLITYYFTKDEKIDLLKEIKKYIRFTPLFLKNLVLSNIEIAKIVLDPKLPINPIVVKLNTKLTDDFDKLLLANAITLTPGTITLDIKNENIFIHILNPKTIDIELLEKEILYEYEAIILKKEIKNRFLNNNSSL